VFWRANHRLLSEFAALDATLITLNCVVMFGVVLIPFTTEAMGSGALGDLPLPPALYALNITFTYLVQMSMLFLADRRGVRSARMSPRQLRATVVKMTVLPIVFLGSIPVAFLIGSRAAQYSWMLVPVVMAIIEPPVDRWVRRENTDSAVASADIGGSDAGADRSGPD
jgi:uncharacterized membrane protein